MFKDVIDETIKMIDVLKEENIYLNKGDFKSIRNFINKKESITNKYNKLLEFLKTDINLITDLNKNQKILLKEKFSYCRKLQLENKTIMKRSLNAHEMIINKFKQSIDMRGNNLPIYASSGQEIDKDKVRALAISLDEQY